MITISQEEILSLLGNKKEPLTLGQICQNLNQDKSKICKQLKKLVYYHEVEYTEIDRNEARKYGGKIKRRIKIYHINNLNLLTIIIPVVLIKVF